MTAEPIQLRSSVIFVKDIQASRLFYEAVLHQKVLMDHGPNIGFEGGFALWQVDHAWQTIYDSVPHDSGPLGHRNLELYFETEALDATWARLAESGVEVIHPLRAQPWGQRVVRVADPDGHIVEIGEPMPAVIARFLGQGMSIEEVAQSTSMPLEIVRQMAEATAAPGSGR